jgi:hypothetical protein
MRQRLLRPRWKTWRNKKRDEKKDRNFSPSFPRMFQFLKRFPHVRGPSIIQESDKSELQSTFEFGPIFISFPPNRRRIFVGVCTDVITC